MTHQLYDLSALAAALEQDGEYPDLMATIRRAADVSSAHRDLHEALLAVRLLLRLTSGSDETSLSDADLTTIVGSLTTTTIILYARATDTPPIDRRPWFGETKLPANLRPIHRELMRLRNKEVAHFGKGQLVDGSPLLTEALVLRMFDAEHPIGHLSSRAHNRTGLARRAERLITMVLEAAMAAVNIRHTEVVQALSRLATTRDPILDRLRTMPVTNPWLLAADETTLTSSIDDGAARNFSRVAVVELHAEDVGAAGAAAPDDVAGQSPTSS